MATRRKAAAKAGFSAEERAAMRERAREQKAARGAEQAGERDLLAKIAEMPEPERTMATRLHELVLATVPSLTPRTWYGMPAWAQDGKVLCFYQSAGKFKTRYATLGFADVARLDDGAMWPTSFALAKWTPAVAAQVATLVAKAAGRT